MSAIRRVKEMNNHVVRLGKESQYEHVQKRYTHLFLDLFILVWDVVSDLLLAILVVCISL